MAIAIITAIPVPTVYTSNGGIVIGVDVTVGETTGASTTPT
jgi:hypothetical protein